jgi:hypothetical protein
MEEGFVEVDMNAGDEPAAFPTVRATVVQASSVFFDTPATIGTCAETLACAYVPVIRFLGLIPPSFGRRKRI